MKDLTDHKLPYLTNLLLHLRHTYAKIKRMKQKPMPRAAVAALERIERKRVLSRDVIALADEYKAYIAKNKGKWTEAKLKAFQEKRRKIEALIRAIDHIDKLNKKFDEKYLR